MFSLQAAIQFMTADSSDSKKKGKAPYGKVKPIGKKIISKPMIKGFKKRTISASKSFFNEPLGFPFARAKRIRPERKKKKR